ncbi:bactofilin family protein, partial [Escherichia coli]
FCWFLLILLWATGYFSVLLYSVLLFIILISFAIYFSGGDMFSDKKREKDKKDTLSLTIIAKDSSFVGDIKTNNNMTICGFIEGNVDSKGGIVFVDEGGRVNGRVICDKLVLNGEIHGECHCQAIEIQEHGCLNGDATYSSLQIKAGGYISGNLKKTDELKSEKVAPLKIAKEK